MIIYLDQGNRGTVTYISAKSSFYSKQVDVPDELYEALITWNAKQAHVDRFLVTAHQKASRRDYDMTTDLTDIVKDILCLDTTEATNEAPQSKQDSQVDSSKPSTSSSSKKASPKKKSATKKAPSA